MRRPVISTREVEVAAGDGMSLVLRADAIVTPAARERARELGVRLETGTAAAGAQRPEPDGPGHTPLQGFCYPLSPLGRAAIVDDPPWHFGGDMLLVMFRADPRAVSAVLPKPLEPGPQPGLCFMSVADLVCCGDQTRDLVYRNPARTQYREGMVAVSCSYRGRPGFSIPFAWTDQDWAMARGWLLGIPHKLAGGCLSRAHALNPGLGPAGAGTRLSGRLERQGQAVIRAGMTINRKGCAEDLPDLTSLHTLRHVPGLEPGAEPSLLELLRLKVDNLRFGGVWVGTGELELFPAENEELELLRPLEILGAAYASVGWTISGAEVLWNHTSALRP